MQSCAAGPKSRPRKRRTRRSQWMLTAERALHLKDQAREIWELIETPIGIRQLVRQLVEEYDIEEADCLDQTVTYLKKLLGEGIVVIADDTTR